MKFQTTLILLALLVIIAAYFLIVEKNAQTTAERERIAALQTDQPGTAVFPADHFPTESVTQIELEYKGQPPVTIAKQGETWRQTQPVSFALNTWSARQLVDSAASLRYTQRFTPADQGMPSLADVSLSPPLASITYSIAGDKPSQTKLHLGRIGAASRGYITLEGDPQVYVVNDDLHRIILKGKVADWRKRSIEAPSESRADRLCLTRDTQTIDMRKTDTGWSFAPPHSGRASTDAVARLANAINYLCIDKFVADNPPDLSLFGLDNPTITATIHAPAVSSPSDTQPAEDSPADPDHPAPQAQTSAPEIQLTLQIGSPTDFKRQQYFATVSYDNSASQVVFTLPRSDVDKLAKNLDDFRDPRITIVKPTDARELTIERPDGPRIALVRGVDGWSFADPGPGYRADDAEASALVESIADAKATAYHTDTLAPHQPPLATVTLTAIGRPEPDVIRIYPSNEDQTYLCFRGSETVGYLVPTDDLSKLFEPPLALRDRTVLDLTSDKVTSITIRNPWGAAYQFTRSTASQPAAETPPDSTTELGQWALVGESRFEAAAFSKLLENLFPLRAESWKQTPGAASDHTPQPDLTVTIGLADQTEHTLQIDSQKRLARLDGTEDWFELGERLVELFNQEYRDRTALSLSTDQIERVSIASDTRTIAVERGASGNYVDAAGNKLNQAAAAGVYDALAGLRVLRYVSPPAADELQAKLQFTISLQLKDDQQHKLSIWKPSDPNSSSLAQLDDRWFQLSPEVTGKLSADLTAPQLEALGD